MEGNISLKSLGIYIVLLATVFLLPSNLFEYEYYPFIIVLGLYGGIIVALLIVMSRNNVMDFEHQKYDYLIFDLIYIAGMTFIIYLISFVLNQKLWQNSLAEYTYLTVFGFFFLWRLFNIDTKHTGIIRWVYLILCPGLNGFIINQILTLWFGLNFMGQGFGM